MSLTERARRDTKRFLSDANTGNAVEMNFTAPNGEKATINGWHTKHHLGVSLEGTMVNSKQSFVSFAESVLKEANANYPIRNNDNEVSLKEHLVDVKDSTDVLRNYTIQAAMPDEKLGVILLTLEVYEP